MAVEAERVARSVALEQAYVHDVYEQFSDGPRGKPWQRVQQFLTDLEPGSLVCDVGCGNGKYLNTNHSVFHVGGDKCGKLVETARDKESEVMILDNLSLPFRDESFDAVLSIAVVHHFATTERRVCALRELARVLRIGGRLIISVWAMEQTHRKFESQDVLVPWHRPQHLSTPSLELTSTTTTSEEDFQPAYNAYTQSDSDSNRSFNRQKGGIRKSGRNRHKGRSIDPGRNSSPSSSSLSSPNETCYSFVRRAIQKLAGGRRGRVNRPWFLDSWSYCSKEPPSRRYDPEGCECCECEDIQNLPIELRRVDDDDLPQRRQTFPSSQITNDLYGSLKSRSLTDIKTVDNQGMARSQSGVETVQEPVVIVEEESAAPATPEKVETLKKPRLVKQKQSICDEDAEEALDKPTDMKTLISPSPDVRILNRQKSRGVLKQRSLNEELMSTDRIKENERVKRNITKQASLNDEFLYHRHHTLDSIKDSLFSVSTSKRFQLIKTGFTNKIKNSTTNIEKVTGSSIKNGFVRMFQGWKSSELASPTKPEYFTDEEVKLVPSPATEKVEEKKEGGRRHSKEDGSDSSKDSSLQSDTSVDSEDSFASVIFIPKADPSSPTSTLSPGPTSPRLKQQSVPNSPRIKQSSCPTSPRIKQMPLRDPLTKQLSSPKPSTNFSISPSEEKQPERGDQNAAATLLTLAQKYSVPKIPKFRKSDVAPEKAEPEVVAQIPDKKRNDRLKQIRELLNQRPGFGVRTPRSSFPIIRHSSATDEDKLKPIVRPMPKLLSLELFNPETDDKDSDSSGVSSPDSIDSVISVQISENGNSDTKLNNGDDGCTFSFPSVNINNNNNEKKNCGTTITTNHSMSLLEAAANVANSLDDAVDRVIRSSPRAKRNQLQFKDVMSVMERYLDTESAPLLTPRKPSWDEECHKHLTDFADKLSEKLLMEIDHYNEQSKQKEVTFGASSAIEHIDDPYIHRLSEELQDLSKLSAEIQKQNEYLHKLTNLDRVSDQRLKISETKCVNCKLKSCRCDSGKLPEPKVTRNLNKSCSDSKAVGSGAECRLSVSRTGSSMESCDSEKGTGSTNSISCSATTSLHLERSNSDRDTCSRCSDGGSTASLGSCQEWTSTVKDGGPAAPERPPPECAKAKEKAGLLSDASQESLPSDNIGGAITYHRYYHVFREGELDQLIERYVENLHIISSYYDHASWCVVAEKVQVWTI